MKNKNVLHSITSIIVWYNGAKLWRKSLASHFKSGVLVTYFVKFESQFGKHFKLLNSYVDDE